MIFGGFRVDNKTKFHNILIGESVRVSHSLAISKLPFSQIGPTTHPVDLCDIYFRDFI